MTNSPVTRRDFLKLSAVTMAATGITSASFKTTPGLGYSAYKAPAEQADAIIPSACRSCYGRCGLLGHVKNGRLVKIEGNPAVPNNEGTFCSRAMAIPELIYSPHRIKYPMKRVGERGEGKWQRISWDEAMDTCAKRFLEIKEKYGAESIIYQHGTGRDMVLIQAIIRLWNEFGSVLSFGVGNLCWVGSYMTSRRIYGDECQYTGWDAKNTKCILMMSRSLLSRGYYDWWEVVKAQKRGAKLIVVDPRFTTMASKADLWIPIRPGTDMAFVLYVTNYLIQNKEYDEKFLKQWTDSAFLVNEQGWLVKQSDVMEGGSPQRYMVWDKTSNSPKFWDAEALMWETPDVDPDLFGTHEINGVQYTTGFQKLADGVAEWTAEKAAEITWVDAEKLELAAKWYAEASPGACFTRGQKVEFSINGSGISHALTNMMAIAGNFDVEGGQNIAREPAANFSTLLTRIPPPSEDFTKILQNPDKYTPNPGKQKIYGEFGFYASTTNAMVSGEPFEIKGYWGQSSEPLLSYADSDEILEGFKNLDFIVNVDFYMTPTGQMSDIILPAAHFNEVDRIEIAHSGHGWPASHTLHIRQPFVPPAGESRDDMDIIWEMAKRLGVNMGWEDHYAFYNFVLKEAGLDFETFRKKVTITLPENFHRHETGLLRYDHRPGFQTYTGKVNIYSEDMKKFGWGPLPFYIEPPDSPYSMPEMVAEYPYIITSGGRSHAYFHSEYRQSAKMRELHTFPTVMINPASAEKEGIKNGDWIWIETPYGKCRQRAEVTEKVNPNVIHAEHDWWFPEKPANTLHGAFDSNINVVNHNDGPYDPAIGTDTFGGQCKIYVAKEGPPEGIWTTPEQLKGFLPKDQEA